MPKKLIDRTNTTHGRLTYLKLHASRPKALGRRPQHALSMRLHYALLKALS